MSQRKANILILILTILLVFMLVFDRIFMINGPGTASVVYKPLDNGVDKNLVYREGVYMIAPWNNMYQFNVREQMVEESLKIMVKNGVTVKIRINYRYYPIQDSLGAIFQKYGPDYHKVFVKPEILFAVRERMSGFSPEEIYSLKLDELKLSAFEHSATNLHEGNVMVSDVLILDIELPPFVVGAIESKLREEQKSEEYDFKIEIALKEKQIKIIEAEAIQAAQFTINSGLTPQYLRYKQIEAMQKLSTSPNAKTLIMPQGDDQNPFILDAR